MLKIDLELIQEKIVEKKDLASIVGSGTLDVFSTPSAITFMENTAFKCVKDILADDETTVGTEISIKHIRANKLDDKIKAIAKLKNIEEKKLFFEIEISDEKGKIAFGTHTRYIINTEKFLKNLDK